MTIPTEITMSMTMLLHVAVVVALLLRLHCYKTLAFSGLPKQEASNMNATLEQKTTIRTVFATLSQVKRTKKQ